MLTLLSKYLMQAFQLGLDMLDRPHHYSVLSSHETTGT